MGEGIPRLWQRQTRKQTKTNQQDECCDGGDVDRGIQRGEPGTQNWLPGRDIGPRWGIGKRMFSVEGMACVKSQRGKGADAFEEPKGCSVQPGLGKWVGAEGGREEMRLKGKLPGATPCRTKSLKLRSQT